MQTHPVRVATATTFAAVCFAHARTNGDVSLMPYDVTTLYFEADSEDELRKVGYSKERRVDPQIVRVYRSTGTGSPWISAVTKATKPRPSRSCRS